MIIRRFSKVRLYLAGPAIASVFLLMMVFSAYGGSSDTPELLSDKCIDDITGGAAGDYFTAFFQTPSTAFIDIEPRWWGDMDGYNMYGYPAACGTDPGFAVVNMPYLDFQYDTFKYIFKNQAEVDQFIHDLPSQGGQPINVIGTDYIKSNPRAKTFLSGDGAGPKIQEIVITTDRKVNGFFVRDHNGQVITQNVRFDLEFLPPYLKTTHETVTKEDGSILERSLTFRTPLRYEWTPSKKFRGEMVRNPDGTYSFVNPRNRAYNFGAVFLEAATTGEEPIVCGNGREVVPPNTVYQRTRIYNDLIIRSPALGMTIGLAPQGEPVTSKVRGDQTYLPDLDHYQEIGILDIRNLTISLKGGTDIYMYANEDLPYLCP